MPHICVEYITKTTALIEWALYLVGKLRLVSINLSEWGTRQYWLLYTAGGGGRAHVIEHLSRRSGG